MRTIMYRLFLTLTILGLIASVQSSPAQAHVTTTTLAVTSGSNAVTSVSQGPVVTLTATVNDGTTPVTPGQVQFCDATAASCTDIHVFGIAQLISDGTATVRFRPGVGSHSYKAVFLGTKTEQKSSSAARKLTVKTPAASFTGVTVSGTNNYSASVVVSGFGPAAPQAHAAPPTGTITLVDTSKANAILASGALVVPTSPGPSLNLSATLTTDVDPRAVAAADFNGDGIQDIAVATAGSISILLGARDGSFTQSQRLELIVEHLTVADFNGDGTPDLAIESQQYPAGLSIGLGNGDGTFQNPVSVLGSISGWPAVAADFNGDGNPDLLDVGSMTILLGKGDGSFSAGQPIDLSGNTVVDLVVGDFNGDGVPDIVFSPAANNEVLVYLGNGDGTFGSPTVKNTTLQCQGLAAGDFNEDGKADLACQSVPGSTEILLGDGTGTFRDGAPQSSGGTLVAVADVNGDGIADLITYKGSGGVLFGDGNGAFYKWNQSSDLTAVHADGIAVGNFAPANSSGFVSFNPEGTKVYVGGILTTQATVYVGGVASTATLNFTVGSGAHVVKAKYSGDSNYAASASIPTPATQAPVPVFSPPAGTYVGSILLTMKDAVPDATLYYRDMSGEGTCFCDDPWFSVYSGPLQIQSANQVIFQAYVSAPKYKDSDIIGGYYTLEDPGPTFSLPSGAYFGAQIITITPPTSDYAISYQAGTQDWQPYSGPITVTESETIYAWAQRYRDVTPMSSVTYAIVYAPVLSQSGGTFTTPQSITIQENTSGAHIRYTTDGSDPAMSSRRYSSPIWLNSTTTLKATAEYNGHLLGPPTSATYTFLPAAVPVVSPTAGTFDLVKKIVISDSTPNALIHYTLDGSDPTIKSPYYFQPITLYPGTWTIKAMAHVRYMPPGPIAQATVTVNPAAPPTIQLPGGTYSGPQSVTITESTPGAVIHYTIDGSAPTIHSPAYLRPVRIRSGTVTLKAIAHVLNTEPSAVSSQTYTIQ